MIAVFLAALALAGAPSSTPMTCVPTLAASGDFGLTFVTSDPRTIELDGPNVCLGDLYAGASARYRGGLRWSNPKITHDPSAAFDKWDAYAGLGLLVTLHEAEHAATGSLDECYVEGLAYGKTRSLIDEFFTRGTDEEDNVWTEAGNENHTFRVSHACA